jgi:two-component system NtrC family sensor kinase
MNKSKESLILVVEDEETIRTLLSRALTAQGYTAASAETKKEAIEHISAREFDLLLIDKNLPDGSGLDIIAHARDKGHRSEAIIITGYSDTDSAIQAVSLGVFRYVRKPFDLDVLQLDINNALERRRLRRDLARRTKDLEETNKELWDALKRVYESERRTRQAERLANIGYLAAGVAHEINNPLSLLSMTIPYVTNEVDALVSTLNKEIDENYIKVSVGQIAHSIRHAQEAVEFLLRLASDLHSLSRTEKQEPRPVKIAEVAGSAARLVRHQLKYKAKVELNIVEDIAVKGHASRLVQVFINLLTNAAKAIQDNNPENNKVAIDARVENDYVVIDVSDTGVGIPEDHLDKIFTPFFTFSLKDEDQGSGIGLALVKEIVDEHGGEIRVSSEKGRGTTFTIRIPRLVTTTASPAIMPTTAGEMTRSRRKILFVDSETTNLNAYEKSFGQMHEVLLASDFDRASSLIEKHYETLDILVCELSSVKDANTDLDGALKKWPDLRERLIFIGEPGSSLDRSKALGYRVLDKPVRPSVLLGAIYQLPLKKPKAVTQI